MRTCEECIHFQLEDKNKVAFCPSLDGLVTADTLACLHFAEGVRLAHPDGVRVISDVPEWVAPEWRDTFKKGTPVRYVPGNGFVASTGDPPPLPAGNSAVETTFQQWMDEHPCDGCPTYEKYKGNPFGEKCATCVRAGQVADNYGAEITDDGKLTYHVEEGR